MTKSVANPAAHSPQSHVAKDSLDWCPECIEARLLRVLKSCESDAKDQKARAEKAERERDALACDHEPCDHEEEVERLKARVAELEAALSEEHEAVHSARESADVMLARAEKAEWALAERDAMVDKLEARLEKAELGWSSCKRMLEDRNDDLSKAEARVAGLEAINVSHARKRFPELFREKEE